MRLSLKAMSVPGRSYQDALKLLDSRKRPSRPDTIGDAPEPMPNKPTYTGTPNIRHVRDWLHRIGYNDTAIDGLKVIHVAGTKGKGSTCAFTSQFLEAHARRAGFPRRVGLYTSPYLRFIEERICINSQSLDREKFARSVLEVLDRINADETLPQPRYLTIIFLIAVHTFIQQRVDVAICETHHGGEYDATNIFKAPTATGINVIGMDHVKALGPTIENIAWHKAGIMKAGSPAFVVHQEPSCENIIRDRAAKKSATLEFVEEEPKHEQLLKTLDAKVQRANAGLAIKLANAFLSRYDSQLSDSDISEGIANFSWPGRFQELREGNILWALDGAHNELSIPHSADWFANLVKKAARQDPLPKVLIFSQISDRDGAAILRILAQTLADKQTTIDHVIFTTYAKRAEDIQESNTGSPGRRANAFPAEDQEHCTQIWREYQPDSDVTFQRTIEGALNLARSRDQGSGLQVLITGSLYLVGGALRLLEPDGADESMEPAPTAEG